MKKNASHKEIRDFLSKNPEKLDEAKNCQHFDKLRWYDWMKILRYQPRLISECPFRGEWIPCRMLYTLLQHQPSFVNEFKPIQFDLSESYIYLYNKATERVWSVYESVPFEERVKELNNDLKIAEFFGFEELKNTLLKIKTNLST